MDPTATYDKAQAIARNAEASYERIRRDQRITDDYRRQRLAAAYVKARDQVAPLRQELFDNRAKELRRLERRAFAVDEKDIASYRDALDRTDRLQSAAEGLELLRRAVRTGDTLQLRALASWAADQGARDVLTALAEHLPEQVDAIAALSAERRQNARQRLADDMHFHPPMPAELHNWEGQVDRLASLSTTS